MSEPTVSEDEIDRLYEAYDRVPLNEPDAWGDLESFLMANQQHRRDDEDVWEE
ncbi:hypothetical protein [Candidatus Poriferisodalis sp.]|uniref:hypothetical protein n=1 Tax=Candidatus Poriferisodalis sp. TaxID=3101277 RepID=UPI003C702BA8